jgi:RNA polymerase sporulation-specific sigma factor
MPDERVVQLGKLGDPEAVEHILRKYKQVVLFKSRSYFLRGADRDDMIQEGMIGLFKAIRDYRADRDCSFRTFADVCITRQMITAVKSATGQRHLPFVNAASLGSANAEEGTIEWFETTATVDAVDPEQVLMARETLHEIQTILKESLSEFEWCVFEGFSEGKSYQQIAEEQGSSAKSVDNALCRVRRKVHRFYEETQAAV